MEIKGLGKTVGIDIDKKQEKTLIYLIVGIIVFVIAYIVYKGIQTTEKVSKPIVDIVTTPLEAGAATLKFATQIPAITGDITAKIYNYEKETYNAGTTAIEQSIGAPTGTYNKYLEGMGVLAYPLKFASALTPDIIEVKAAQAGATVRSWFSFLT